jgi:uncharacterized protein YuzE
MADEIPAHLNPNDDPELARESFSPGTSSCSNRVLNAPARRMTNRRDPTLEHRLGVIAEFAGRVLRVVVNPEAVPIRVGTVYFDRTMNGATGVSDIDGSAATVSGSERVRAHQRQSMKLHVDPEADALYFRLNDSKMIESEEVSLGVVLDYDAKDEVVGLEILFLSKRGVDLDKLDYHASLSASRRGRLARNLSRLRSRQNVTIPQHSKQS